MDGYLIAPNYIGTLIRRRQWTDAQTACEQLCKLDLMTVTPFRDLVRDDLKMLVPPSLNVMCLRSRRFTYTAALAESSVDWSPPV